MGWPSFQEDIDKRKEASDLDGSAFGGQSRKRDVYQETLDNYRASNGIAHYGQSKQRAGSGWLNLFRTLIKKIRSTLGRQ